MTIPWDLILKYAKQYDTDPALIAAIGQHETRWGELGAGKIGFETGYGYYGPGNYDPAFQGLETQVERTAWKMSQWGIKPGGVTLTALKTGNAGGLPTGIYAADSNWPNAVYTQYTQLKPVLNEPLKTVSPVKEPFIDTQKPHAYLGAGGGGARGEGYETPAGIFQTPAYFLTLAFIFIAIGFLIYRTLGGNIPQPADMVKEVLKV